MPARSFAPTAALVALLAATVACGEDPQSPTSTDTVRNLGTLGGTDAAARAINNTGGVVGWSTLASGRAHAFPE